MYSFVVLSVDILRMGNLSALTLPLLYFPTLWAGTIAYTNVNKHCSRPSTDCFPVRQTYQERAWYHLQEGILYTHTVSCNEAVALVDPVRLCMHAILNGYWSCCMYCYG